MGSRKRFRRAGASLAWLAGLALSPLAAGAPPASGPLKLLLSVEQPRLAEPFPMRLTLHLHNGGAAAVWLYRHVQNPDVLARIAASQAAGEPPANVTSGGSSLAVHLEPLAAASLTAPGRGEVLESVGLPHPDLVKLEPGADYEEGCVAAWQPAARSSPGGQPEPVWGRYRLWVDYRAQFSNRDAVARATGVPVWSGTLPSPAIEIDLEPPPASAAGSVAGLITDEDKRPLAGAVVSLSDRQEHLVGQLVTGPSGRFSFEHLPFGLYWVTARRELAAVDTAIFEHVELTPANPAGTANLILLSPEVYEPKQMLHKPVLFRVTNSAGQPVPKVTLQIVWSSGTVLNTARGETADDGTAALDLIPGRNYVTLKRRRCPNEDQRVDVAEGDGIDGFGLTLDCAPK